MKKESLFYLIVAIGFAAWAGVAILEELVFHRVIHDGTITHVVRHEYFGMSKIFFQNSQFTIVSRNAATRVCLDSNVDLDEGNKIGTLKIGQLTGRAIRITGKEGQTKYSIIDWKVIVGFVFLILLVNESWRNSPLAFLGAAMQVFVILDLSAILVCQL